MTMNWPFDPLVPMSYGAILIDPPWNFRNWSKAGEGRHANRHYPVMSLPEIRALPVSYLGRADVALFMWVSTPFLPQALEVMGCWGFQYKTIAFTWVKRNADDSAWMGGGYWTRSNPEICLLGTIGKPTRRSCSVRELIEAPRREHSRKPDEVATRIEELVDGPYCELFARASARPGWDFWGNETGKFE